jgi:flagellar basal-body rod protein FlgC
LRGHGVTVTLGAIAQWKDNGKIMSVSALSAGASGLNANQQALGVAANNIANAGTQGYQAQQAQFQEASPAGSGVTLSAQGRGLAASEASIDGPSGTDLASDITNSLVYKASFDLNAKVVQAAEQRIGTLIDIQA